MFHAIAGWPLWGLLLLLVLAFTVLARCADVFVDRGIGLARRLRLPAIVIGVVLVSLATTVPEVSVTLLSALAGHDHVAMGNAIGSVICNTGLALGVCAFLSPRPIHVLPTVLRLTGGFLLVAAALTLLMVLRDCRLTRGEGALLLVLMAVYLARVWRRRRPAVMPVAEAAAGLPAPRSLVSLVAGFALALVGVVVASRFVLVSAIGAALRLGVPEAVIALSLVALGTSIPEVATSIVAARRGQGEIAVGNILGASVLNLTWVIGMAAMIRPLSISPRELLVMFPAMFLMVLLTLLLLKTHTVITRREGLVLIVAYLGFLAMLTVLASPVP